ncbi:YbjN domain-containing protein [Reinekea thalattae]|uniref:YbjN domain-containing protein n=1 Tax=Reinekea thalattae TaxID=2593301 RepID=A0A5C8Z1Y2_9GAMM|nr:YbjN domain-containing protein [Reinekea thalattae]TXR52085.1 hypothetical protein FME95_11765 [Reinekea thalattae]
MPAPTRDNIQTWIEDLNYDCYICDDCDGLHLAIWEAKSGVMEARCFAELDRCAFMLEVGIRASAVLPLQGAIHFMNFDYSLVKVMLNMTDFDVPRLLLTHALPANHLTEVQFKEWLPRLLAEIEAIYEQLVDMDVLHVSEQDITESVEEKLH